MNSFSQKMQMQDYFQYRRAIEVTMLQMNANQKLLSKYFKYYQKEAHKAVLHINLNTILFLFIFLNIIL